MLEDAESDDPQSQCPFVQPQHPFTIVKPPNSKHRRHSPSIPFSPTKADFTSLASKHELSQGLSIEFDLAYKRYLLQNKASQLTFLY
jgi:hypothetical protein